MSDTITIGVDHGYAAMKSTHFSYPTGLVEYEHEPYTQKDVLEYGGRFYVVGSGRQPLQKDKTVTEDYYLLTLAAIAKELAHRGAEPTAAVHLAAGLPLTSFGRDKKKFRAYLLRDGQPVSFRYEGIAYTVTIAEVSLFPQGYAAVLTQQELLDEPSAIAESGLDARAMPAVFLGGGAALLKRHVSATDGLCRPLILDDVCLNAKGYERLVGQLSRGVKVG